MQRFDSSSSDSDDLDPLVAPLARTAIDFEAMGAVIDDIATSLAELLAGVAPRFRPPLAFESEPEQHVRLNVEVDFDDDSLLLLVEDAVNDASGGNGAIVAGRGPHHARIIAQLEPASGPPARCSDGDDIAVHRISHGRLRSLRPPIGRGWPGDLARAVRRVQRRLRREWPQPRLVPNDLLPTVRHYAIAAYAHPTPLRSFADAQRESHALNRTSTPAPEAHAMSTIVESTEPALDASASSPIGVAVVGYGYWGPNLARNFAASAASDLTIVCDVSPGRLGAAKTAHPWSRLTANFSDVLDADDVELVVVATPPETHREIAESALLAGKHVLVEKPLATTVADAVALLETARRVNRHLLVDHTFLFTGAVRRMKQYIDSGELGDVYYFDSTRINLGLFQSKTNVLWDLAPHDISILLALTRQTSSARYGSGIIPR